MILKLAYTPGACSLVPYVLLTEAGADFTTLPVNMAKGEQNSPDYLKINPKGKVPALIINGDPMTENVAIQLWIANQFPQARLMPEMGPNYYKAISLMSWCSSGIHPKLTQQARPERYCDLENSAPSVRRHGSESLFEMFALVDQMLERQEWFFDRFSCPDAYFYWCFRRGSAFQPDTSIFKNCTAHMKRMEQRLSVQKLLAYEASVQAAFNGQ